jgi:hypothetical protein
MRRGGMVHRINHEGRKQKVDGYRWKANTIKSAIERKVNDVAL